LDGTCANKDNKIAEKFADSLEERLRPFELVPDEETAVTEAFYDVSYGPASQILPINAEEVKDQIKRRKSV